MATVFSVDTVDIGTQPWGSNYPNATCAISDTLFAVAYGLNLYTYDYITKTATLRKTNSYLGYRALRCVNGKLYGITRAGSGSISAWNLERINMETWTTENTITAQSAGWNVNAYGSFIWYDDNHILESSVYVESGSAYAMTALRTLVYTDGIITGFQAGEGLTSRNYVIGRQYDNLAIYNNRYYCAHRTYRGSSALTEYRTNVYSFSNIVGGTSSVYQTHAATGGTNSDVVKLVPLSDDEAIFILNTKIYRYNYATNVLTDTTEELPSAAKESNQMVRISTGYVVLDGTKETTISLSAFDIKYKIVNNDGSATYIELNNAPPITGVSFSRSGYDVSYTLASDYTSLSGTYESTPPTGKIVVGYALQPNANEPLFEIGTTVSLYREEDTTFYEVYSKYNPPATTFDMNLYHNAAEPNRVDKSSFLTSVGTLSGALRAPCSIKSPSIVIQQTSIPRFNYVYIPAFYRYYFVSNVTSINYKLWQIDLEVDPLMSYKAGVITLSAVIARQEFDYNADLVDTQLPLQKDVAVDIHEFATTPFDTTTATEIRSYVLTVIGA